MQGSGESGQLPIYSLSDTPSYRGGNKEVLFPQCKLCHHRCIQLLNHIMMYCELNAMRVQSNTSQPLCVRVWLHRDDIWPGLGVRLRLSAL